MKNLGSDRAKLHEGLPDEMAQAYITRDIVNPLILEFYFIASQKGLQENPITGVRIVLKSPQDWVIPRAFSLTLECTDNVVEYNALISGLQIARDLE